MSLPVLVPVTPRSVTLTVQVVLQSNRPDELVDALREFVDRVRRLPATVTETPIAAAAPRAATPKAVHICGSERTVRRGGVPVDLTRREFDLLLYLARHPRQVFSRTQLLREVWGTDLTGQRTVDVHVTRLRTKVGLPLVDTVRGVGYRLDPGAEVSVEPP